MENDFRLKKIGIEKVKAFDKDFDGLYEYYKNKAEEQGYHGSLKFIKERGKVLIYTILDDLDDGYISII